MYLANIESPKDYGELTFIARCAAQELLHRLQLIRLQPELIVDLGCHWGRDVPELQLLFPHATVYGLDHSVQKLRNYGFATHDHSCPKLIAADAAQLPFPKRSVSIIYANLLLPWIPVPRQLLNEWRRVLQPNGLIIFSCFGPDSFQDWHTSAELQVIPSVVDMHCVGDALVAAGFTMPVVEAEILTIDYSSQNKIQQEMYFGEILEPSELINLPLQLTVEIIYAHAWCPAQESFTANQQGEVIIPLKRL